MKKKGYHRLSLSQRKTIVRSAGFLWDNLNSPEKPGCRNPNMSWEHFKGIAFCMHAASLVDVFCLTELTHRVTNRRCDCFIFPTIMFEGGLVVQWEEYDTDEKVEANAKYFPGCEVLTLSYLKFEEDEQNMIDFKRTWYDILTLPYRGKFDWNEYWRKRRRKNGKSKKTKTYCRY